MLRALVPCSKTSISFATARIDPFPSLPTTPFPSSGPHLHRSFISSSSVMGTSVEAGVAGSAQASKASSSFREAIHAAGIFPRDGPDPSARSWGHHRSGITFAAQEKLPKLPLPSLKSSCTRYLEALKPLQSAQEQEASAAAVQNFLHGEGPILQAQLEEYDSSHANYFEHFCEPCFPT